MVDFAKFFWLSLKDRIFAHSAASVSLGSNRPWGRAARKVRFWQQKGAWLMRLDNKSFNRGGNKVLTFAPLRRLLAKMVKKEAGH
ncbi:hypothetical protein [Tateyamaria sp. SN3-11]|uniref:hypothetical protein n=1 Tax=Tateyamaria sp. SN3-11 TaxID=3092147 RepID=UPI0039E98106